MSRSPARRWRLLASALSAALLLGLGWWAGSRSIPQSEPVRPAPRATEASPVPALREPTRVAAALAAPEVPLAEAPSAAVISRREPLPGALPLAELVSELEPRARAGDPAAACRLAAELVSCRYALRRPERGLDSLERQIAQAESAEPRQLEALERRLVWEQQRMQHRRECEALPASLRDSATELLFRAALQGHVPSMVSYARADGIGGQDMIGDPQLYAQYRQHAFPMWQRALKAGSVEAVQTWIGALNSGGFHFLAGALPAEFHNRQLALALMAQIGLALGIDPATAAAGSESEAIPPSVQLEAEALFARYFAGSAELQRALQRHARLMELAEVNAGRAPPPPMDLQAERATQQNARCDDG